MDKYCYSVYLFSEASKAYRNFLNYRDYLAILDKAIEVNPNQATFYYMRARWRNQLFILPEGERPVIKKDEIVEDLKRALVLDPNWRELREYFEGFG